MIRFLTIQGEHLDDNIKTFAFYNTVNNEVLNINGSYTFASVADYESVFEDEDDTFYIAKSRLDSLIPDSWKEYEKSQIFIDNN